MAEEESECVGSLLVHSKDLHHHHGDVATMSEMSRLPIVLQKRPSVGTLLVSSNELQFPAGSPITERLGVASTNLRKRVTARMAGPAPKDEEADTWAD
jgi:hypothetical protein